MLSVFKYIRIKRFVTSSIVFNQLIVSIISALVRYVFYINPALYTSLPQYIIFDLISKQQARRVGLTKAMVWCYCSIIIHEHKDTWSITVIVQ